MSSNNFFVIYSFIEAQVCFDSILENVKFFDSSIIGLKFSGLNRAPVNRHSPTVSFLYCLMCLGECIPQSVQILLDLIL